MTPRRAISLLLLSACGAGGDPSAGSQVTGVLLVPQNGGSNGQYVSGVANGPTVFLAASANNCGGGGSGCGQTSAFTLGFAPPTQATVDLKDSTGALTDVALSSDGATAFWAQAGQATSSTGGFVQGVALWSATSPPAPGSTVPAWSTFPIPPTVLQGGGGVWLIGLAADATTAYVAVAQPTGQTGGSSIVSPDSPCWIQKGEDACSTSEPGHVTAPGYVFAVPRSSPGVAAPPYVSTTFDPGTALHTLVDAGSSVCWLDAAGHVACATKGWAPAAPPSPTILAAPNLPPGWSLVAIASSGSTVAWAAAPDVTPSATGCLVWQSVNGGGATPVYDGSGASFFCRGLALDGQYAYVTMNELASVSSCQGCSAAPSVIGTGIARVALTGGAPQTIPLASQSWYGPRRVLVDDTYVYAVDPSYVVRVPKTAFGQ